MKRAVALLLFLTGLTAGCGTARQEPPSSNSSVRYFSGPAGREPVSMTMQDVGISRKEAAARETRDLIHLETRYFSVTLPRSVNSSGLAREIAGSVKVWKEFHLAEELDGLYQKVLQTTELYKTVPDKIRINFEENFSFSEADSLRAVSAPAAYFPEQKTIYAVAGKTNREVMAHEMAHAALHLYTGIRMSRNVDEAVAVWTAEQLK